jgi:DNA-3-methyladenine glycosylase I
MASSTTLKRCRWPKTDLDIAYHDKEWGVPVHDDEILFEFLILEGAQAGLSWSTILKKRENYQRAYDGFDPKKVATYGKSKIESLLNDPGIVRNRLKVLASVQNAKCFLNVQKEFKTFNEYLWGFVGGSPLTSGIKKHEGIPARSRESDALSEDLRSRGFKFVGTTICYAFMQAIGMVNDHTTNCYRYKELNSKKKKR